MKYFSLLLILLSLRLNAQEISFEQKGPYDRFVYFEIVPDSTFLKPCFELYARDESKRFNRLSGYFNVDIKTFQEIKQYVNKKENNVLFTTELDSSWGSCEIRYKENGKTLEYFFDSNEKSFEFFKELLPKCESNEWLYEEIEVLLKRLH